MRPGWRPRKHLLARDSGARLCTPSGFLEELKLHATLLLVILLAVELVGTIPLVRATRIASLFSIELAALRVLLRWLEQKATPFHAFLLLLLAGALLHLD